MKCMECLNKYVWKKEENITLSLHVWVGMIKSLTVPNYLILRLIKYESYGFNADLIEAIN